MAPSPTYQSVGADIIRVSADGDNLATQETATQMCAVFADFLTKFVAETNGYMAMAAFVVTFTEIKKVIAAAPEQDRVLLTQLVLAVIGSFGKVVQ